MDTFWERLVETDGNFRRAYPRVQLDAPITVLDGEREECARLHDIGRGGLQLRCDRTSGARLAPNRKGDRRGSVLIRTVLRDGAEERVLEARCALVHMTLLTADSALPEEGAADVALGFCFVELEQSARKNLEWFILRSLEPA